MISISKAGEIRISCTSIYCSKTKSILLPVKSGKESHEPILTGISVVELSEHRGDHFLHHSSNGSWVRFLF